MDQATSLRSSSVELEAFHASTRGISIGQFRKNISRRIATSSAKKSRPMPGQSAIQISVVIPTDCRPHLLRSCMQCLVEQSFDKNFYEVIVVSDTPDEETETVVNSFKEVHPAISYFHLPEKRGPAAARNMGWQRAWGKLVAFTEDDCLPDRHWLATLYKTHRGEEEIAYTGVVKAPRQAVDERNNSGCQTAEFATANCCCTKLALERVEGFDERFSMAWREDKDLEFKLLEQNIPVVKVEEAVVVHPVREAHWAMSIKEQKKGVFNALLFKKFPTLYRERIQNSPPWNYYMITIAVLCLSLCFFLGLKALAVVFAIFWLTLTINFIAKRLRVARKNFNLVVEMIVTCTVIPLVSIYWQLYGAIKYRTLFI